MPSVASDFQLPVKKVSSDIGLVSNYTNETDYNLIKGNLYRRTVTLDNTTRSAKTNYTISFTIDHLALWRADKTAFNFCDLRVFDTDGITPLTFEVQGYATSYTLISVLVPSIASNSTKNIFIEYGNPALAPLSNSTGVWGSIINDSSILLHSRANEAVKLFGGNVRNNDPVMSWRNVSQPAAFAFNTNPNNSPVLIENQLNGLPVMRFNGVNSALDTGTITPSINGLNAWSFFFVARATTVERYNSIIRYQNGVGSDYVVYPHGSSGLIISSADGGLSGISAGLVSNQWNLANANWNRNTTNGFNTYRNGGLVAQRNSANAATAALRLGIGNFPGGEFFNGDLAEVIILSKSVNTTERQAIENYLNTKYRIYSTSDMPTITVGSESTISGGSYTYISQAPFASWQANKNLKNIVYGSETMTGKASLQNLQSKTLASGVNQENWSNSTQYNAESNELTAIITTFSRTRIATTTQTIDEVNIDQPDPNLGGINQNSLVNFYIYNELSNDYTLYTSDDNDVIEFEFACQTVSTISLTNSFTRFLNTAGTTTYTAAFNLNVNSLEDETSNKMRFRKSAFTKVGSGNWGDMTRLQINVQTSTGSQSVYYADVKLIKNIEEDTEYQIGSHLRVGNAVSSDEGATYYVDYPIRGVISSRLLDEESTTITAQDYLERIRNKKMGELNSFPTDFVAWSSDWELSASFPTNYKSKFYTYFLKKVLGFAIPNTLLDVNLDLLIPEDTVKVASNIFPIALNHFTILEQETVGDVVDRLLEPVLGSLVWDTLSGKYIARTGYRTLDTTVYPTSGSQLDTPYQIPSNLIDEYKNNTSDNSNIYNYIKLVAITDNFRQQQILTAVDGGTYEIKANSRTTIFIDIQLSQGFLEVRPIGNLYVAGWNVATSADSTAYNNTGVSISDIFYADGSIGVTFVSTTSVRYLRQISIGADYIAFYNIQTYIGSGTFNSNEFSLVISDQNSIAKNGRKELVIDSKYAYVSFDPVLNNSTLLAAGIYTGAINTLKTEKEIVEVSLDYIPDLRVGRLVRVRNKTGRMITGVVSSIEYYSEPPALTQTVKVTGIV